MVFKGRGSRFLYRVEKEKGIDLTGRLVYLRGRDLNGFLVRKKSKTETEELAYVESLEGMFVILMSDIINNKVFVVRKEFEDLALKLLKCDKFRSKSYLGRVLSRIRSDVYDAVYFNRSKLLEKYRPFVEDFVELYIAYMKNDKERFRELLDKLRIALFL